MHTNGHEFLASTHSCQFVCIRGQKPALEIQLIVGAESCPFDELIPRTGQGPEFIEGLRPFPKKYEVKYQE